MSEMSLQPITHKRILPVTIISGFLGAGKTTIIHHLLNNTGGKRLAILVNDMSEINIDGDSLREFARQAGAEMVELQNGCICCTLRADLLQQIKMLADMECIDHLIIESTGISEPRPVAEIFHFPVHAEGADGKKLSDFACIDSMVTVVDPQSFMQIYLSDEDLDAAPGKDAKALAELLVEQVEHADTLVLTRADSATQACIDSMRSFLGQVNPAARILVASQGVLDPGTLIGTRSFSRANLSFMPHELTLRESPSETDVYAFQSMVWRARRPLDPARFFALMESLGQFGQVLRCKGVLWVCTVPDKIVVWQQAGVVFRHEVRGMWWVDTPRPHWPSDAQALAWIDAKWAPGVGDRRQELVFIGRNLDKGGLAQALEQCLLSQRQYSQGPSSWRRHADPFAFHEDEPEYLQRAGQAPVQGAGL